MNYLLIAVLIAIVVLVVIVVTKPVDDDDIGQDIRDIRRVEEERRRRLIALNKAYSLAKEELGEEPTIEQIMLTRDTLEDVDGTP